MNYRVNIASIIDKKMLQDGIVAIMEKYQHYYSLSAYRDINELQMKISLPSQILIIDTNYPSFSNHSGFIDTVREIRVKQPSVRIIAISDKINVETINRFFEVGGIGFVSTCSSHIELIKAIERATMSQKFVCSTIGNLTRNFSRFIEGLDHNLKPINQIFTSAENNVLQLISKGYSTKKIADLLNLSEKTIETHRKHLFDKSGVKNVAELMSFAFKNQLILN